MIENDDYEAHRDAIEADQAQEIHLLRTALKAELDAIEEAIRAATRFARDLASERVYDVEVCEGPGRHTPAVLEQMLVTVAGIRAVTVEAGR